MQRVTAGCRVIEADPAARLHRIGDDPVVVEMQFGDMRGGLERRRDRIGAAGMPVETEVAGSLVRQLWRARRSRCGRTPQRRRAAVIDRDMLGGVERPVLGLRHDQRDRFADIANLARGQQRLRREREFLARLRIGVDAGSSGCSPSWRASAAVSTASTPGIARAAAVSMRRYQHAHAASAARRRAPSPGKRDRRDTAAAGQKAQVFAPLRRVPDAPTICRHLHPFASPLAAV